MKKYIFQIIFLCISAAAFAQPLQNFHALYIYPANLTAFTISGNVVTANGEFTIIGADDDIKVTISSLQTYTLSNFQNLVLDVSGATNDGTRWNLTQTAMSVKGTNSVGQNDIILLTYHSTASLNEWGKWDGLCASIVTNRAITAANNWVMLNSRLGNNVKMKYSAGNIIVSGPVEIFAKDGNAIRIIANSYPYTITPVQSRVLVLNIDSAFTVSGAYHQYNFNQTTDVVFNAFNQVKQIPLLIYSSASATPTGGVLWSYNQVTNSEKKEILGGLIVANSTPVSDARTRFAHDSHTIVQKSNNRLYQLTTWMQDRYTTAEWATTSECMIKVYDLTAQKEVLYASLGKKDTDYKNGITTGGTGMVIPRMWPLGSGDTIRIAFSNYTNCYYRDLSLRDMSLTLPQKFQVKISGGASMDWDSSAIRQHLQALFGYDSDFLGLAPFVRGNDQMQVEGSNRYLTFEGYPTTNPGGAGIPIMGVSSDGGRTWQLKGAIFNGSLTAGGGSPETSMVWLGGKWNALTRIGGALHYSSSTDGGNTWATPTAISSTTLATKETRHSAYKTVGVAGDTLVLLAYQATNNTTGHRTTMGFAKTSNYTSWEEIAICDCERSCHYPTIALYAGRIFGSYTTSFKNSTTGDRDAIMRFWVDIASLGRPF